MSRHGNRASPKTKRPKTTLGLPDLDHSKSPVLDSLRSSESKRGYRHAIDEFIQWYRSEPRLSFNKVAVTRYRIFLENRSKAEPSPIPEHFRCVGRAGRIDLQPLPHHQS